MSNAMLSQDLLHTGHVVLSIHRPKGIDLPTSGLQDPQHVAEDGRTGKIEFQVDVKNYSCFKWMCFPAKD